MQRLGDTAFIQRLASFTEKHPPLEPEYVEPTCATCGGKAYVRREVPADAQRWDPRIGAIEPCPVCLAPTLSRERFAAIWGGAQIPPRFQDATLDTYPVSPETAPALAAVRAWLDGPTWALLLHGQWGVGKTGLAVGVLRQATERNLGTLFSKVPDVLTHWRSTFGRESETSERELLESLRTVPVLALDDLGADKTSDWAVSALFQVLDHRHAHELRTVVTTNLTFPGEVGRHLGPRTMHRFDEGATVVEVAGPNLRRPSGAT